MSADDLNLVFAWRCNPEIYRHFRGQDEPLSWDDHVAWFESRHPERFDFVVSFEGRRVGVVSLNTDNEVSVYLGDVSARGRGVASAAVEWLCERFADRAPIGAEVHRDNDPSKRLFERCEFKRAATDGEWLRYAYHT
jgi:RimJ/RimL family protein N-acetyltransferase